MLIYQIKCFSPHFATVSCVCVFIAVIQSLFHIIHSFSSFSFLFHTHNIFYLTLYLRSICVCVYGDFLLHFLFYFSVMDVVMLKSLGLAHYCSSFTVCNVILCSCLNCTNSLAIFYIYICVLNYEARELSNSYSCQQRRNE